MRRGLFQIFFEKTEFKTTTGWVEKVMWMRKGEEHEWRLLGLKHRVGRVVSGRDWRLDRLARPDYAGPCGPW